MKSINAQIDSMAARYPNLPVDVSDDRFCVWQGPHVPYHKRYLLKISYRVPLAPENLSMMDLQPRVQVVQPILERHAEFDEGPIPHIYESRIEQFFPYLCLFDPYAGEWSTSDLIAHTTIPWAERWLLNYEFWLATGVWRGGGRHMSQAHDFDSDAMDELRGAA